MKLRNLMEEVVQIILDDVWAKETMCTCQKCRLDIMARALNNLPPRYLVTDRGQAFSRADLLELQKSIDVIKELTMAIQVIKKNPRH